MFIELCQTKQQFSADTMVCVYRDSVDDGYGLKTERR